MGIAQEFKDFALRGNVVDMAVGIIIGVAFGKVVSSLVSDILMPPVGLMLGGVDFVDLVIVLKAAVGETPAVVIAYGRFIQTVIDFFIIALAIFVAVKVMNSMKEKQVEATPTVPPVPTVGEKLLTEIRDLLKQPK